MSTTPSQDVHDGWYIDYSRSWGSQTQYLCRKSRANIWTNFLGIVVVIALGCVFRLFLKAWEPIILHNEADGARRAPTAPEARAVYILSETIQEIRQERTEGRVRLDGHTAPDIRPHRKPLSPRVVKIILFMITYVGFLACGVVTAYLATDSKALSRSSGCGLYVSASNSSQSQGALGPFAFQAQLDSAQQAETCYHTTSGADSCNFFVQQSISYTPSDGWCPFVDGMCHENMSSASHFSTGPTDAATVGIHAPKTFQFKRNTTCAPLNGNQTYISTSAKDGIYTHTYNYGSRNGFPFTWQMRTHDSNLEWQPRYLVDTVLSGPAYEPISSLTPPKGSSLTLMFIHPQKISYLAPSDDPIFPANTKFYINSSDEPRWRYTGQHASVLACVDTTVWRDPSSSIDWKPYPPEPTFVIKDAHTLGGFLFMVYTLLWSNIFDTINYRLGNGLAAQKLVRGWQSLPLAKEQWKVEAQQLFETSLTRIQIDARNIAQGTAASYPGLRKLEVEPAVCDGTFLFVSRRWQNVNVTGSFWIGVLSIIFMVLAFPLNDPDDRLLVQWLWGSVPEPVLRFFMNTIPNVFTTTIPEFLSKQVPGYWRSTIEAIQSLLGKASNAWSDLTTRGTRRD